MRLKRLLIIIGASLAALFALGGAAYAVSRDEVVQGNNNHSVYKVGQNITVTGTVNGDIICAGQTVNVDATVNGDVLCAGQTVTVNGAVHGSVRLVGQTVTLGAKVDHGVSMVGQDVTLDNSATVGQDASLAGQNLNLYGKVSRDLAVAGSQVVINNTIGRDVSARAAKLNLDNQAKIGGNLSYVSPQTLSRSGGAQIAGKITYTKEVVSHNHGFAIWGRIYWILALAVLSVILVALFPAVFRHWNLVAERSFWWVLLVGFIAMFAVPVIIGVLVLTFIGIPLAILLFLLWLAAFIVSMPLAAYFGAHWFVPRLHPVLIVLIGAIALGILEMIPFIGWIFFMIAYWVGVGILLVNMRRFYGRLSAAPAIIKA